MKRYLFALFVFSLALMGVEGCRSDKAPEPVVADTLPVDSALYTYNLRIKPIFDLNCAKSGCHDATTRKNGVNLSNYASAKDETQNGKVVCTIEWSCTPHMPDDRDQPMPKETIRSIKIWRALGCPE